MSPSETAMTSERPAVSPSERAVSPDPAGASPFFFPQGILGFPACRRFHLMPAKRDGFFWLRSVECGSLCFLLVDPFELADGFFVDLSDTDLMHLEAGDAPQVAILAIVTLPSTPGATATANLQGLVAFNFANGLGRQIIVHDSSYGTRWPLDLQRRKRAS